MDVLAVDYDEEGINSKVMYSIVEGGNKFGNVENAIKTKTTFNRLEKDSYRITVQAKDQGDQGQGSGPGILPKNIYKIFFKDKLTKSN